MNTRDALCYAMDEAVGVAVNDAVEAVVDDVVVEAEYYAVWLSVYDVMWYGLDKETRDENEVDGV